MRLLRAACLILSACGGGGTGSADAASDDALVDAAIDTAIDGAACMASSCTSPPADVCASATSLTTYPATGTCDSGGSCAYTGSTSSCSHGCSGGQCNPSTGTFVGDATATSTSAVTLDKEANLNASSGSAPAGAVVTVRILGTPSNAFSGVTMSYTVNDFATPTAVTMALSLQSGGNDTFEATIPAQAGSTTVRFFFEGMPRGGSSVFDPGSNVNYTYVAQ